MAKHLTTTETMGRGEVDQPKVGPEGVRLAGASESKDTESTEAATPETDDQQTINAIDDLGYQVPCVDIDFSRKLERQRDEWREIAARLALACIADGGDFREEVLRDYRNLLEEAGE